MDSELIAAVKERVERGYSDETIREELQAAGYGAEAVDRILGLARGNGDTVAPIPEATGMSLQLPKVFTLVSGGLSFTRSHIQLVVALVLPLLVILFAGYAIDTSLFGDSESVLLGLSLVTITALVLYFFAIGTTLRMVSKEEEQLSYREGFTWARRNFWSLLWIYILTSLVTFGGTMLFIVPGIIVSFLVYFSQYVLAAEEKKGVSALLRSRDLVKGRWWAVVTVLFKVALIFIGILFLFGFFVGMGMAFLGEGAATKITIETLGQIMSGVMTIVGLHIGMKLYRCLVVSFSPEGQKPAQKWQYIALSFLGLVAFVAMAFAVAMSEETLRNENQEKVAPNDTEAKQRALDLREAVFEKVSPSEGGEE